MSIRATTKETTDAAARHSAAGQARPWGGRGRGHRALAVKEARRFGEELDRIKVRAVDPFQREALPTLRRDPATGEWRVM